MTISNEKPFLAGNWKMHKTIPEAVEMVKALKEESPQLTDAELVVIPPYTMLSEVKKVIEGSTIQLGAQNIFWEEKGAFTGEISPPMLKDAGCQYVTIGHSERRQYFGETNETVNKKIKAALAHELTPIMCIGESLEEREKGNTMDKVETQINSGLEGLGKDEIRRIVIAYEPIWAIGTGVTATPSQAEEVHSFIRKKLTEKYGNEIASYAIILYGGSVKPANTYSILKENNINGALVGGASLEADSFIQITKEAIKAYKEKK
ncbi:MAG: triose-phosphate isomerase [Candidatus Aminicenantes bacterium]|nr:MAG: triose-phosphate isomerase [Candidatus Aminicenantes bacterium]